MHSTATKNAEKPTRNPHELRGKMSRNVRVRGGIFYYKQREKYGARDDSNLPREKRRNKTGKMDTGLWRRPLKRSNPPLPYPHPSVNPTVKRGGTAWMTADRHHSPPDQINRRLKCHRAVTFFPSLPHSAFTSTTHRKMLTSDLVCCQPPIRHKGANSRC